MRYPTFEKLETIRIVERSHLPAKVLLAKLVYHDQHFIAGMNCISSLENRD